MKALILFVYFFSFCSLFHFICSIFVLHRQSAFKRVEKYHDCAGGNAQALGHL